MKNLYNRVALGAGTAAFAFLGLVGSAAAEGDASVGTAVSTTASTLTDTITAAVPLILGVVGVIVVLTLGKKLLKKAG